MPADAQTPGPKAGGPDQPPAHPCTETPRQCNGRVRQGAGPDLLDVQAVADLLGYGSSEGVYAARRRGCLPDPARLRPLRWRRADLEDWLARTGWTQLLDLGMPKLVARTVLALMRDDPGVDDAQEALLQVHEEWRTARRPEATP